MADAAVQSGLIFFDEDSREPVAAPWAGRFLALGARLARQSTPDGWQLVVAVSVPARGLAAMLVGAGWVLTQPCHSSADVLADSEAIPRYTPVRMATARWLVADCFYGVERKDHGTRVRIGRSGWQPEVVNLIVADPALPEAHFGKIEVAQPGSLVRMAGHGGTWPADQCAATPTVALVGVKSWLEPELALRAAWAGGDGGYDRLRDILRPRSETPAFCASAVLSGGREFPPEIPGEARLAVLDGATAIRWLPEITTPFVVAVIDRSSFDESAGTAVLQRRSMGRPVPLDELGWPVTSGVEALAFRVRVSV